MELEELKYLFIEHSSKAPNKSSPETIAAMLKRRSASQTAALKKNLLIELVIAVLFSFFPVYILTSYPGIYTRGMAILFLLTAAAFGAKIIMLLSAIHRYERTSFAIKQRLRLLIDILNRSARLYVQSTIVAFPLLFAVAALLVYLDNQNKDTLRFVATGTDAVMIYVVSSLLWCVAMYFFTQWYVKKLYGNHINQLQSHLNEMA